MIILPVYDSLNINKLEQRLIQIFAYFISTQFLHELMYLGMDYAFKFSNALNLENSKGNFYMSNLLYKNDLYNPKFLFKYTFKINYTIIKYNSFLLFKKFYNLINKINPILNILDFIVHVGARSNKMQHQQIVGMRGFLNTNRNYIVGTPLLHNFEKGLNLSEYISSAYGVRKGLLDTSLQTSESGYLTRRLVEVIQDIVIKEFYCGSNKFLILRKYNTIHGNLLLPPHQFLFNKYLYKFTNNLEFYIKAPILCYSGRTVCTTCMGFSCTFKILGGESAGVIFGELLGEPSTQLTLRTFHTGGILNMVKTNNFYIFKKNIKHNFNFKNFKFLSFILTKNIYKKNKINIFNTHKFLISNNYFNNLFTLKKKFNFKNTNLLINFLIIYKFNFFILYPIYKSFIRYYYKSSKIILYNILINFYLTTVLIKNKLKEWVIILLNNNLNYFLVDYFISNAEGGVFLNTINMSKSSIVFNLNIIY